MSCTASVQKDASCARSRRSGRLTLRSVWGGSSRRLAGRCCDGFSMDFILVYAAGAFAVVLGIMHFTFPERFGFRAALSGEGPPRPPFRLWFYRYDFKRSDLYGVVRVMNHCVSFTILSVGVCDLLASRWLGTAAGTILAGWIAAFWFVRAATQLYLGRRRGDWFVVAWFGLLGIVHVLAALR